MALRSTFALDGLPELGDRRSLPYSGSFRTWAEALRVAYEASSRTGRRHTVRRARPFGLPWTTPWRVREVGA